MATSGKVLLLIVLNICLISSVLAADDDVSGLQRIFKLRFIFDEDPGETQKSETSVILIQKAEGRSQDPIELQNDRSSELYPVESYSPTQYRLPDSTLMFCFIVVIFYMVYISLRMFIKPDVETSDPESVDTHILHQLLLSHQFSEAVIPEKLRSLYDDGDQSGVTDLSKVTLIIDPSSTGVSAEGVPEKVPLDDELCVYVDGMMEDEEDAPPPYPGPEDTTPLTRDEQSDRSEDQQGLRP